MVGFALVGRLAMKRSELLILTAMLILAILFFSQKLYPQITNLFSDTAKKISVVQMAKV
jgi:hypothetical protein